MPAVLKIDIQRRIVCSTFHGEITEEMLLRHAADIVADPNFDPDFAEIVDFTGALPASVRETTLRALAQAKSVFREDVPHVVVAPADELFAIAVRYRELSRSSRPNLLVVRSLAKAYELLSGLGYDVC